MERRIAAPFATEANQGEIRSRRRGVQGGENAESRAVAGSHGSANRQGTVTSSACGR